MMRRLAPGSLILVLACSVRPIDEGATATATATTTTTPFPTSSTTPDEPPTTSAATTTASPTTTTTTTTSTSTTTTGEPDPDTAGDEGCQFFCPPDIPAVEGACDPGQGGCPDGEKCVWFVAPGNQLRREAARCIPVTGDRAAFDPCQLPTGFGPEISDDCGADSYCLEVYGSADHGFCAPYSEPSPHSCDAWPGTSVAVENGSNFPYACLFYECDPLDPSTCPEDMTCTFYPAWLYGINHCWRAPPDDLPLAAACDYGECGDGKLCISGDAVPGCTHERCCAQWCDLGAPECADDAAECQPFIVPEFPELGACLVPGWEWG
jgi:hypothetical protein